MTVDTPVNMELKNKIFEAVLANELFLVEGPSIDAAMEMHGDVDNTMELAQDRAKHGFVVVDISGKRVDPLHIDAYEKEK